MSEPQSSGDVDRVLDSIRKLVSSKLPERAATRDRLMLTSDLRVPQEDVDISEMPVADDALCSEETAPDQSLEARIAQLESAVAAEQGFEPDGSEQQDPHLPVGMPDLAALFEAEEIETDAKRLLGVTKAGPICTSRWTMF